MCPARKWSEDKHLTSTRVKASVRNRTGAFFYHCVAISSQETRVMAESSITTFAATA